MASADAWLHHAQNILRVGRLTHLDPEIPDGVDADPEVLKKLLEAKDPYEKRLKPISLDAKIKGNLPGWVIRFMGDKTNYI